MARVVAAAAALLLGTICGCDTYDSSLLGEVSARKPAVLLKAVCGDGRVDDSERCDVAILDGMEGACPTTCPSDDPCYLQVVAGYDCQALCVGVATTFAVNGDGCCPPGIGPGEDSDCGFCGDGIIGPNETCDPPETCPVLADCPHAGKSCLFGVFRGDPQACTSECHLDPASSCEGGDNCCPAGCTAATDSDCSASCGNHIVEPAAGETCEVGDPDHPCDVNCDDGSPCTRDLLVGSVENCNVECANVDILVAMNDDGCCPPGAHADIDNDCLPVCGNGVREGDETCDPCDQPCEDGDVCTLDTLSGDPATCSAVCSHTAITQATGGDGCCPLGANANSDSDCSPACGNGILEAGEECDGSAGCGGCVQLFNASIVHRYAFDGTGSTAVDSEGGDNGTIKNASVDGSGNLVLVGGTSGHYVDLPDRLISSLTSATVEVWLTFNGGNSWQRIFDFGYSTGGTAPTSSSSATSEWFISPNGASGLGLTMVMNFTSTANDTQNDQRISLGTSLSQNAKHQVVGVFNDSANTMKLYVDGALVGTKMSVSGTLSQIDDRNVWIGRSNYGNDDLKATVHEVRIYDKALSDAEISASFAAGDNP